MEIQITPPKLHKGQQAVWQSPARFNVLSCGRRWGKSRLGALRCIYEGVHGRRAWWVAPSYPVAAVGWRMIKRLAVQIPGVSIREMDRLILFANNGMVQVRSADNPDSLRGEGLDYLVLDECAFIKEAAWTEALRPALSDRQGRAMFISTPAGRNWFWRLWQRGHDDHAGEWKSWRFPTAANPYIVPEEIEAARQSLPELTFEQEYLAVFLEGQGAVFRNIAACLHAPLDATPEAHAGHRIVAGLDWGKQKDFTATSIGCADCKVELARDRFNKIDYVFQRDRLKALYERWGVSEILAESNSMGVPNLEMLQREGLPVIAFETTATSKPPLIENLALTFERAEWQFQADPVWTGELEAYERKVSPVTGRSSYGAPEGLHDDTIIGRALMRWQANQGVAGMRQATVYQAPASSATRRTAVRRVPA